MTLAECLLGRNIFYIKHLKKAGIDKEAKIAEKAKQVKQQLNHSLNICRQLQSDTEITYFIKSEKGNVYFFYLLVLFHFILQFFTFYYHPNFFLV